MIYEMNKKNDPKQDGLNVRNILIGILLGLLACLLITMCSSCTTTKYVTVPEYHTDTLWQNHTLHDSIYMHDSTYVYEKGDTLLMEKWHTKYVLKEVHDTTYISKTDTVPTPYPVEVKVEKKLSTWQSFRMTVGTIALCILAIYFIYKIVRKKLSPPAL